MVSSGIEPLIPALLARCLNQLGQETRNTCVFNFIVRMTNISTIYTLLFKGLQILHAKYIVSPVRLADES